MSQQTELNNPIAIALTFQTELSTEPALSKTIVDGKQIKKPDPEILDKQDLVNLANQYHQNAMTNSQAALLIEKRDVALANFKETDNVSDEFLHESVKALDKSQAELNMILNAHLLRKDMENSDSGKNMSAHDIHNGVIQAIVANKVPEYPDSMKNEAFVEITSNQVATNSVGNSINSNERTIG